MGAHNLQKNNKFPLTCRVFITNTAFYEISLIRTYGKQGLYTRWRNDLRFTAHVIIDS